MTHKEIEQAERMRGEVNLEVLAGQLFELNEKLVRELARLNPAEISPELQDLSRQADELRELYRLWESEPDSKYVSERVGALAGVEVPH